MAQCCRPALVAVASGRLSWCQAAASEAESIRKAASYRNTTSSALLCEEQELAKKAEAWATFYIFLQIIAPGISRTSGTIPLPKPGLRGIAIIGVGGFAL